MAALLAVVAIAWEPGLAVGWEWRLGLGLPIASGGIAATLGRYAGETPPERRTSFWAYRKSNWMLAAFLAALVWATASVML
jgi:hypothetical protein